MQSETPHYPIRHDRQFFEHVPALDGLRGIAILLVLVHNAGHFGAHPSNVLWITALVGAIGWIGVQLFFVLSGFLITSKLLATQDAPNYYSVFFGRRILRIFPLYYAALVFGLIVVPAFTHGLHGGAFADWQQVWLWTFLFNWAHPLGTPAHGFPHFWSLAVEEQFYLIWPFVVHKLTSKKLARICLGVITAAFIIRTVMALEGASEDMIYEFTICRMDALAMGALIAAWLQSQERARQLQTLAPWMIPCGVSIALVGAVLSRLYTRDAFFTESLGYTCLGVFFSLLLLACLIGTNTVNRGWQKFLSLAPLRAIGKYSFAIYVFHFPLQLYAERFLPPPEQRTGWLGMEFLVGIGLVTYIAAFLSYHLYEKHFLKLKSWFTPHALTQPPADAESLRHA
jgi:peptidoglycan/LPS O-acetylase OafA/YrhL